MQNFKRKVVIFTTIIIVITLLFLVVFISNSLTSDRDLAGEHSAALEQNIQSRIKKFETNLFVFEYDANIWDVVATSKTFNIQLTNKNTDDKLTVITTNLYKIIDQSTVVNEEVANLQKISDEFKLIKLESKNISNKTYQLIVYQIKALGTNKSFNEMRYLLQINTNTLLKFIYVYKGDMTEAENSMEIILKSLTLNEIYAFSDQKLECKLINCL